MIRLSENAGRSIYNGLQICSDRRFTNGLGFGVAYTCASRGQRPDKRDLLFNAYDDTRTGGCRSFDRRHLFNVHYIYDLPFLREQDTLLKKLLGGWQVSGVTFLRSGTPFTIPRADDVAGVGDTASASRGTWSAIRATSTTQFSAGPAPSSFNPGAFARPAAARSATRAQPGYKPGLQQWDIALFKNFPLAATDACSCAWRRSTSSTTRTWAASKKRLTATQGIP